MRTWRRPAGTRRWRPSPRAASRLTDKNDTVYTFTQPLGSGAYGITSIADALGHTETFTWTSSSPYEITQITAASGRTLELTWATASGAVYPHVSQVFTNPVTGTDQSTALTWGYNYSGDELASVCPPQDSAACTTYTYGSGSDYPESVLDSGPESYWRLDETSGTKAASSVMLNEGTDNATYSGATGTDAGPLAGSTAPASTFDGTSSQVTLPQNLVSGESYQSVSLWFKTTTANGVLFSYQSSPLSAGTTTGGYTPSLYIGSDGKLYGQFWQGGTAPMATSATVTDGKWHLVTLTAAGNTQTLYLDGGQAGASLAGTVSVSAQADDYIGAGFLGGNWPNEADYQKSGGTGYATYFTGDISDAAFWTRPLTANEVTTLYGAGTHQADLLTGVTRPSGKTLRAGLLRSALRPDDLGDRRQRRHLDAATADRGRVQPAVRGVGARQ